MTLAPDTTNQSSSAAPNSSEADTRPTKRLRMDEPGREKAVEEFSKVKDYRQVGKGVAAIKPE
jgi:hypothetical protein